MSVSVGLVGCGTIGREIARAFAEEVLTADLKTVYDRNMEKRQAVVDTFDGNEHPTPVNDTSAVIETTDLVVEAAGQSAVRDITIPSLKSGCDVLLLSVGALADTDLRQRIINTAEQHRQQIHVPSGAIGGLDAVKAAALTGDLESVSLRTTKNPDGLEGAPYLETNDFDIDEINESTTVFTGTATEAAMAFPSNINVAIALSLAGIGPNKTTVQIVADPKEENNVHHIEATGTMGSIETTVQNVPSPMNPKTSYLAAVSAVEKLRGLEATVRIGN